MFNSPFSVGFAAGFLPLLALAAIWTVILKGFALWFSARGNQRWWFVALLLINTLGILEIIYLIWFRPGTSKKPTFSSTTSTPEGTPVVSATPENDSSESK